jgi:hypothetical protein
LHEAGLLAAAVAEALAAGPPASSVRAPASATAVGVLRPTAVHIRVHDPLHVAPASAVMYADLALRERGLAGIPITVTSAPVACAICEVPNDVHADHPFCSECGFPLPDRGGHAVEVTMDWDPVS